MESRRMRSRSQILKWVCYAVALFVCAALQTTPGLLQLGQAKPLFILPLCLAVAVYEGEFAGALFGAVSGLLWDYTAGRTVGMLALELLLEKYSPAHKTTGLRYAEASFARTEIVRLDVVAWSGKTKRVH
jgi:cell shape-determining protein MreD